MKNILFAAALLLASCTDSAWKPQSEVAVSLVGIQAVNIDNAGQYPVVDPSSVQKEAYMLGVRWQTTTAPTDDDQYITPPGYEAPRHVLSYSYRKAVRCVEAFNADIPAGSYVSKYFKQPSGNPYLPEGVDEGFALLVAPDAGMHSFIVEYSDAEGKVLFTATTSALEFR